MTEVFVLDTSAIIAVLNAEAEARAINALLSQSDKIVLSSATAFEAHCVLSGERFRHIRGRFEVFLAGLPIEIVPFDRPQLDAARIAYSLYGRGSGHRAGLNMGDCFSYALAKSHSLPLLFKGDDFIHTDLVPALMSG